MSHISTLSVVNLKGATKQYLLSPLTYIHGPNKSNKSTVIDAIQIALLGYHPAQAKTNAGTMELASADSMSVAVGFADGSTVYRGYTAGKSVKADLQPLDWKTDLRMLPSLDHSLYFGKTDNERVQQVMNLSEGLGAESRVPAIVARFKGLKAKNHTEIEERVLTQLVSELPAYNPGSPVQLWLASLLEWAKDRAKAENARTKSFEGTNVILTEANAIDSLTIVNNIAQLRQEMKALVIMRDQVVSAHAKLVESVNQQFREAKRRRELTGYLDGVKPPVSSAGDIKVQIESITTALLGVNTTAEGLLKDGRDAMGQVKVIDAQISDLNQAKATVLKKVDELNHLESCPICKAASDGWKAPAKDTYLKEVVAIDDKISVLIQQKSGYTMKADALRPQYTKFKAESDAKTTTVSQLQQQLNYAIQVETDLGHWRAELQRLGQAPATEPSLPPQESPDLQPVRDQMTAIQTKISELEGQESERKRIAQVRELALESRAALELSKLMAEAVREEQAKIVEQAFGPVLEVANKLVEGIMLSPIAYFDGRVGRYLPNGRFIPVSTFSGSELRLTQTAITAGLARQARHKIAIIDETGILDVPSLNKLVENADKVVQAGLLDQVIMLGVVLPDTSLLSINVLSFA